MKKSLFMMGMVVLALASCTNEEVVNIPASKAIGFSSFVGNPTKATTEMDGSQLQTTGFYVWGGRDGLQNFTAQQVTYKADVTKWEYAPLRYWEANETYRFAAFAPDINGATATFNYDDGHVDLTGYVADINNPEDLVYAKSNDIPTTAETGNSPVGLSFKHVLSWVKIKFVNGFANGTKLTIENVDITGVLGTADFTDGAFGTPQTEQDFTPVDFSQTAENGHTETVDFTAIPQNITSFVISFNVTVETADGNNVADNEAKSATINVQWAANNIYNYTATIDGSTIGMQAIEFNPSVERWGTTNPNQDVTIQ